MHRHLPSPVSTPLTASMTTPGAAPVAGLLCLLALLLAPVAALTAQPWRQKDRPGRRQDRPGAANRELDRPELRVQAECADAADGEVRADTPLSFVSSARSFAARRVRDEGALWAVPDELIERDLVCTSRS